MSDRERRSGMEPPVGGQADRQPEPDPDSVARADRYFKDALRYIERMHWGDASVALRRALATVPGYPQASGLLALVDGIRIHYESGIPDSRQLEALRAYIAALQARPAPPSPARAAATTPGALADGISLPWAEEPESELPVEAFGPARRPSLDEGPYADVAVAPPAPAPRDPGLRVLSAANPLDHLRVLVWFFMAQPRLTAYSRAGQWRVVKPVLAWLSSTVLWLPLAMPVLGLTIGTLPAAESGLGLVWMSILVGLLWALGGWLAFHNLAQIGLMIASAIAILPVVLLWGTVGWPTMLLVALLFLAMGGVSAGLAQVEARQAAIHLALGATYVTTVAAAFRTFTWIRPVVLAYVRDFVLGSVGGPVLIGLAVFFAAMLTLGVTYVVPYIGNYLISFMVQAIAEGGREASGLEMLGMAVLVLMALSVAILGWVCFLGGYNSLWWVVSG